MTTEDIESSVPLLLRDAGLAPPSEIERMTGGIANHVYRVDGRWTVRIGTGSDGVQFPKSADILRTIEGRVKAQHVVHTDFTRRIVPYNVMICEYIEGTLLSTVWPAMPREEKRRGVRLVVEEIRRLHTVPIGEIPCFASLAPWPQRIDAEIASLLEVVRSGRSFRRTGSSGWSDTSRRTGTVCGRRRRRCRSTKTSTPATS